MMNYKLLILASLFSTVAYSQGGYGIGYALGSNPLFLLIILIITILIIRLFGAWMLRINDVISELKGLRMDLRSSKGGYPSNAKIDEKKCPMCAEIVKGEAKICKHCTYKFPPPKIEKANSEIPYNLGGSKPRIRNLITVIITGVIVVSFVIFYIDSYVDLNGSWRQPTSIETSKLISILKKYETSCDDYYVKEINNHEYIIACMGNSSEWIYREIDTDKEKMYYLSQKAEQKLNPPE